MSSGKRTIFVNRSRYYLVLTMNNENHTMSRADVESQVRGFVDRCRQSGRKVTAQRIAIYRALIRSDDHPSAEMVFRRVKRSSPSISLDTVNRTLLTLFDMGEASIVEGTGDPRRFDAGTEKHQHFRCIKCKRIIDFHHKPFDEIKIPARLRKRFTILRRTIYLEGVCDRCRK
jgi:Fur family peroxide stress response transcriptional regulator